MESPSSFVALLDVWLPGHGLSQIALVCSVALVAGLARGFSGFGAALIFIPLAGAATSPKIASAVLLVVDMVLTVGMLPDAVRRSNRREVATMSIGALCGIPAGTYMLATIDAITLRWLISGIALMLLAFLMTGWRYHGRPKTPLTIGVGAVAGLFSGAAQLGGPPVVAYWLGGAISSTIVRANIILYFAISSLISLASYLAGGLLSLEIVFLSILVAPAYAIGLFSGARLFGFANEVTFRRICFGLIAVAALIGMPAFDGFLR